MDEPLPLMFIILTLLLFAKVFGELFERIGVPSLTGEVIGGFILGPSVLGLVTATHEIKAITDLGVLMLIILAGMEIQPSEVKNSIRGRNIWIAVLGFAVPMLAGMGVGYLFNYNLIFNLFLGLCFAITALPITIRILMDMGKLHSEIGQRILSAAVFNDIVSLLFLGVILDFNDNGSIERSIYLLIGKNVLKIVLFMGILLILYTVFKNAKSRLGTILPRTSAFLGILKGKESLFAIYMIFVLGIAALAQLLGMHFIIGAFFGAILFPRELFPSENFEAIKGSTSGMTMGFLAPIFFAYLGVLINFKAIDNIFLFFVILVSMISSKIAGGYLGGRLALLPRLKAITLGIGMNTKGIMELVIATLAFEKGFIDITMFTILIVIALVTTMFTPFVLKYFFKRADSRYLTA
jgi:Kef-type K+ transport system membrane component KefB